MNIEIVYNIAKGVHSFFKRDQYNFDFSKFSPVSFMIL